MCRTEESRGRRARSSGFDVEILWERMELRDRWRAEVTGSAESRIKVLFFQSLISYWFFHGVFTIGRVAGQEAYGLERGVKGKKFGGASLCGADVGEVLRDYVKGRVLKLAAE